MPTPIPQGYHSVVPYLVIDGASRALEWYKDVFSATEVMRLDGPNGKIGHAEILIGGSHVMVADEHPEVEAHAPGRYGGSPASIVLYVTDVDTVIKRALAAGATVKHAVEDKFYGDRMGSILGPVSP
jgi:PhnB protein